MQYKEYLEVILEEKQNVVLIDATIGQALPGTGFRENSEKITFPPNFHTLLVFFIAYQR
jgi:hypothetical protein